MQWKQITEERYDEMLGVVFPRAQDSRGFLMGEPITHDDAGKAMYRAYRTAGGGYYESREPITVATWRNVDRMPFEVA